jgi:hypothetical protein
LYDFCAKLCADTALIDWLVIDLELLGYYPASGVALWYDFARLD